MSNFDDAAMREHKRLGGKIGLTLKDHLDTKDQLSTYYTPGVAAVSSYLAMHPDETRDYTWTNNTVAVVSDGTAVLGLGNIGPEAALPVMEGKAMLFKHFAGVDAIPIVLNVHTADEIVATVKALAPSFGGINLEDIAAPICFEVEERLKSDLKIPVFHDDQHGTAIVVLAGLINAMKVTNRVMAETKIVVIGAGAAGTAIMKLIHYYSPSAQVFAVDSKGVISPNRSDLNSDKQKLLAHTNRAGISGSLEDVLTGADVFIGVSKPGLLTSEMVKTMAPHPIIFALSNPTPEIMPDQAHKAGAAVVATGRSDFPNQVNNALVFPGIFRGALDNKVEQITNQHKLAVAEVVAGLVEKPDAENIIPSILDDRLVPAISKIIV